jgi:hypothetical protein
MVGAIWCSGSRNSFEPMHQKDEGAIVEMSAEMELDHVFHSPPAAVPAEVGNGNALTSGEETLPQDMGSTDEQTLLTNHKFRKTRIAMLVPVLMLQLLLLYSWYSMALGSGTSRICPACIARVDKNCGVHSEAKPAQQLMAALVSG